jgi:hypothetical protein
MRMLEMGGRHVNRVLTMTAAAPLATAAMALGKETARITLDEAIELSRENNPTFLTTQNDEAAADWGVREAVSNLIVPSVTAFGQLGYRSPGLGRIGTINTGGVGQGRNTRPFIYFKRRAR